MPVLFVIPAKTRHEVKLFSAIREERNLYFWEETMRAAKLLMLLLMVILMLGGCAGIKVNQDYDPGTDFSGLRTFSWGSETQPKTGDIRVDNPLLDSRIRRAIDATLINMGYRKAAQESHDFKVNYTYGVRTKFDSSSMSVGTGFGIGRRGSFGGIGVGTPVGGGTHDEALLVIDFTDPREGDLLWRGTGSHRIDLRSTPAENTAAINTLVEKVLTQFPVSHK
jgi:hypothetical protein